MRRSALVFALVVAACGPSVTPPDGGTFVEDAGSMDAGVVDAGLPPSPMDAGVKAQACASTFGSAFTNAFGRADGTVVAVVPPAWQCPLANNDHLVIQVSIDGGVQRLVVNVQSSFGDPRIRMRAQSGPSLPAPSYAEGWHTGVTLDYPADFGLHSDGGFDPVTLEEASVRIYDAVNVGAPLSVYGTSSGGATAASAHLIHRNGSGHDGAIVVEPTSAQPTWMLFHFADQTF
jgi:hypothetical protein